MKKKIIYYSLIVLAMLVLSYAFVPAVLEGKIVNQSDISGWQGMSHEMMSWNEAHPEDQTAWTESMFGGMPTTTIHASTEGDWTQYLYDFLLIGRRPATYLFISLLGAWLLLLAFGVHPLIALGGAVAMTFCAYNLQIIQVGHNTKMQALAFLPWVLAALVFSFKSIFAQRRWLLRASLGAALFGLSLSFQVKANHPQITYYLAIMIFIYAIVELIWMLRNPERRAKLSRFAAVCGLLLVLGCTGIATNAIKLLPTIEYTPYSMRGGSTKDSDGKATKGLDLDYATAWSYGWEELPNLLIPNFNGGSSAGAVNPSKSQTYELLKSAGQPNLKEVCKNLPLYWGPQPFTAGPMYMGAVCIFLFVLGLGVYKGREKYWILATAILAIFLALGSHFLAFTKLFYDYVPLYNKFRTVSMALVLLQICLPLLAFISLDKIVRQGALTRKNLLWSTAICAGFCLLCAIAPSLAGDFSSNADAGQPELLTKALQADRRSLLQSDALRSAALILASGLALLWGTGVPKSAAKTFTTQPEMGLARRRTASLLLCALVLVDMLPVAHRYLNGDDFTTPRAFQKQFEQRTVDKLILADTDPSYRVLDLTVNVFNDSHPSYWHKNIGGYSPAKLQRYQEFIEARLTGDINAVYKAISGAQTVQEAEEALPYLDALAKMNCRYIIVGAENPPLRYKDAKGNAWFEDSDEAQETLAELPRSVELLSYAPNCLTYAYETSVPAKLVFSEVYYPVGWTLKLENGEELKLELEDEILRSAIVPAGKHTLVMRFDPPSYKIGKAVSRASSILLLLVVLGAVATAIYDRTRGQVKKS